jgi:4-amino-4-deoxy-L-arabinose transferase-like glycosyltransferase
LFNAGATSMTAPRRSRTLMRMLPLALIPLLLALLTLNRLGASDVCGGSEAAMAVYVQQMVGHSQLLFPLDNCTSPMYKPPLYHWTAAGLAALLRQRAATPVILRLPSALYAIAGAILTMALAANLLGRYGAILAGLILCGSYQYISQARIGLVDMTLTFCETLALYTFFYWFTLTREAPAAVRRRTLAHYLLAAAMGFGVLAKGPVGALLPGAAILLFLLMEQDRRALAGLFKLAPLMLGVALASSWYLACVIGRRYDFLHLQIGVENFGRFFGSLGAMPPSYYVQPLLLNSLPLSLFVPLAVITALLPRRGLQGRYCAAPQSPRAFFSGEPESAAIVTQPSTTPALPRTAAAAGHFCPAPSAAMTSAATQPPFAKASPMQLARVRRAALAARLLAIFWIFSLIFFDFAAYKRRAYLLPLWPASAFMLAWCTVDRMIPLLGYRLRSIVHRAAIATCVLLAAANFLFIPAYELHGCGAPFTVASLFRWSSAGFAGESSSGSGQTGSYRDAAAQINRLTSPNAALYSFGFVDALEPLIFYLDRCAPPLYAPFSVSPNARIIAPADVWDRLSARYPGLMPFARIAYDHNPLVLLGSSAVTSFAGLRRQKSSERHPH